MKKHKKTWGVVVMMLAILLSACNDTNNIPASPTIAPTPQSQQEQPTSTPKPLVTQNPTIEVQPTTSGSTIDWKTQIGTNLASGEFANSPFPGPNSNMPGIYNVNYTYSTCSDLTKWHTVGVNTIRIPVSIERALQPQDQLLLKDLLNCAHKLGINIILEAHNYALIVEDGQARPIKPEELTKFWSGMAQAFIDEPAVVAYGLMNEPHDIPQDTLITMYQSAINAIRTIDNTRYILIDGNAWSHTDNWPSINNDLLTLQDPAKRIIFDAHLYFDKDFSGQYECEKTHTCNPDSNLVKPRLEPFVNWCNSNNKLCFIGEIGVPYQDPAWKPVLDATLNYLANIRMGATLWAGGPMWQSDYLLRLTPEMWPLR